MHNQAGKVNAQGGHREGARLTGPTTPGNVNFMARLIFLAALPVVLARPASAQYIPGRDLLAFPISSLAEAPALASATGDGLLNPAAIELTEARGRVTIGALTTPADQGVAAQYVSISAALPRGTTAALSFVRAAVNDLIATDADPMARGKDIPYSTQVLSVVASRRQGRHFLAGLAVRYRTGEADLDRGRAAGIDGGVIADSLSSRDLRLGLSTYLWRPAPGRLERNTFHLAGDLRLLGSDRRHEVRGGYSLTYSPERANDHLVFVGGRQGRLTGRAGLLRASAYGNSEWRLRLAGGIHHARYFIGLARDDSGAGLAPTYQFTMSATIQ